MTANLLYALGTLLTWVGWYLAFRTAYLGIQLVTKSPGLDVPRVQKGLMVSALSAAVLLATAAAVPKNLSAEQKEAFLRFPLVWFVMPAAAWLAVASLVMVALRLVQAWLAVAPEERLARAQAAGVWALAGLLALAWYKRDAENKIEVLRGGIDFTATNAITLLLLALAGMFAMVIAGRATATRGFAKGVVTQAALVAGSIVFGLPFAFLVVTSFKEDRDMSSPNGIVWIPKVQETVPYFDKKNPLYEGLYKGQTVQGSVLEYRPDGTVRVDIFKPMAIRGTTFETQMSALKEVPKMVPLVTASLDGQPIKGMVVEDLDDGRKRVAILEPPTQKGKDAVFEPTKVEPVRHVGLRWENYSEAISFLPPETNSGLVYLKNTLIIVIGSVIGTILSSSIVAYAFSRMQFPGRNALFAVLLSTMMLPAAVTLLPQFLIFRQLGWIDTLYPLWVPAFFGSAFNIFLLRQFFMGIPMELEDASKIDGCSYLRTFWSVMLPQIKPALAVIAIWTFMGAWNNFMGPLIYVNSPENMPLSYALQLFQGDRSGEPGLLMAFATLAMLPVLALFFFAQRYFIEGVTLSGLGGR
jgi:multiple sugar transport system permease protein